MKSLPDAMNKSFLAGSFWHGFERADECQYRRRDGYNKKSPLVTSSLMDFLARYADTRWILYANAVFQEALRSTWRAGWTMTGSSLAVSVLDCSFDDRLLDDAPSTDHCARGTLVRGGVSLQSVDTCSPQDLQQEWTVRLSFQVVVGGAISTWIAAVASLLVGLKSTCDQKLSSGSLLTFMTTHLCQPRFADAEQYWLITLTFFRSQRTLRPVFPQHHEERH